MDVGQQGDALGRGAETRKDGGAGESGVGGRDGRDAGLLRQELVAMSSTLIALVQRLTAAATSDKVDEDCDDVDVSAVQDPEGGSSSGRGGHHARSGGVCRDGQGSRQREVVSGVDPEDSLVSRETVLGPDAGSLVHCLLELWQHVQVCVLWCGVVC